MSDKLKPCPFCGGESRLIGHSPYSITCCKCRATTVFCNTPEKAIDAWNNRVEFNLSPKEIEELRKNFSSAIHDIPVSYYTEVRKPCNDECTQPTFTPDELDAIRRMFRDRYPRAHELPEIEQSIIRKCDAVLKGENVE